MKTPTFEILKLTNKNIEDEHICCAMSSKIAMNFTKLLPQDWKKKRE